MLVTNITNGHKLKCDWYKPAFFLFRLKWFKMNEIRQNIPESELCFCFLFGIWIGTRVEKQTKDSKGILGPGRMVEDASRWYGPLRVQKLTLSVLNCAQSPGQSFHH